MCRTHIAGRQREHEQKRWETEADETHRSTGNAPQAKADIGGHLHRCGSRDGLTQGHARLKGLFRQPLLLLYHDGPHVRQHRRPTKGGGAQLEKGQKQVTERQRLGYGLCWRWLPLAQCPLLHIFV